MNRILTKIINYNLVDYVTPVNAFLRLIIALSGTKTPCLFLNDTCEELLHFDWLRAVQFKGSTRVMIGCKTGNFLS